MTEHYVSEDGYEYKVELKEGLTDEQIDELAKTLPTGQIPAFGKPMNVSCYNRLYPQPDRA